MELTQKIKMLEMRKEKESRSVLHELEKAVEEQAKVIFVSFVVSQWSGEAL